MNLKQQVSPRALTQTSLACEHNGWIITPSGAKPCPCAQRAKLSRLIPPEFASLSLESLKPDLRRSPMQGAAILQCQREPHRSYFFYGEPGTGKTMLAMMLYRQALAEGRPAVFLPLVELLDQLQEASRNPQYEPVITPKMLTTREARYLIALDDFSAPKGSVFRAERLHYLLDFAKSYQHQVIITAHLNKEELALHWEENAPGMGAAIVRRIVNAHQCKVVPLPKTTGKPMEVKL